MVHSFRWAAAGLLLAAAASALVAQKTPDEALRALQDGNRRFAADRSVGQPLGEGVRRTLARGQNPFAIVLCCADSRVPPEHVFNTGLGEIFVVRLAGHAIDPETLASIEYAVDHLNVPLCVVLGHESCGAVAAATAMASTEDQGHGKPAESQALQGLLEQIEPAVRKVRSRDLGGKELTDACEEEHAQRTVTEGLRRSPLLRRYAQVGKFRMVAARYHLRSGEVEWLPVRPLPTDPETQSHASHAGVPMGVPPHVALRLLQAGHRRFLGDGPATADLTSTRREQLTHGQQPLAIVLCCADSRVAPEHIFDAGLGELFVIRVAGNTLNDDVLASIEYAAAHTGASMLVVMGHTRCGAVTAAAEHPAEQQLSPNLRALLGRLEPSVEKARASGKQGQDLVELAIRANVHRTLAEARSRSALLRSLEHEGRFAMLPVVYDLASGDLTWLKDLAEPAAAPAPAPAGETAPSHGKVSHGSHDEPTGHGTAPAADHGGEASGAHGGNKLPVLGWANEVGPEVVAATHEAPHSAPNAAVHDGAKETVESQKEHAGQGAHEATSSHGVAPDPSHGEGHEIVPAPAAPSPWGEPIVVVGIAGVASLLLAALVAALKK
jgi:carbonic anhydrase